MTETKIETKPKIKETLRLPLKIKAGVILNTPHSIFLLSKYADEEVMVAIGPVRRKRTESQNNWWWGFVIPPVAEKTGMSQEEAHRFLEGEFCPRYVKKIFGKDRVFIRRCSQLTKSEFSEVVERVRAFLADFGIIIQEPDPKLSSIKLA